ncbi:MAG: tol-pal system protein YbgF [Gammaproteobacteria bacterium]|nr:tol-pal system protein YbgF [Gammaproteobacteria bacterium]
MRLLILSLLLTLSASVAADPVMDQRVQILERKVRAMNDLITQLGALQREVQQLRGELELQNHAMDALKKRQRDLYLDIDNRLNTQGSGASASKSAVVTSSPVASRPAASPVQPIAPVVASRVTPVVDAGVAQRATGDPALEESAYQKARDLLMDGRYDAARSALGQFLVSYPQGKYSGNAQYWLAEASYVTRDYDTALQDFDKVIRNYPESAKVPDAMLKSGLAHYSKQQWQEARTMLEALISKYPSSTASRLARQRLERMRTEGR